MIVVCDKKKKGRRKLVLSSFILLHFCFVLSLFQFRDNGLISDNYIHIQCMGIKCEWVLGKMRYLTDVFNVV